MKTTSKRQTKRPPPIMEEKECLRFPREEFKKEKEKKDTERKRKE